VLKVRPQWSSCIHLDHDTKPRPRRGFLFLLLANWELGGSLPAPRPGRKPGERTKPGTLRAKKARNRRLIDRQLAEMPAEGFTH